MLYLVLIYTNPALFSCMQDYQLYTALGSLSERYAAIVLAFHELDRSKRFPYSFSDIKSYNKKLKIKTVKIKRRKWENIKDKPIWQM